jgi:hemerythrin superfamily protein
VKTPAPDDLVALLEQDHRDIEKKFSELEGAGADFRAELFWKLTDLLVRHEVAEEMVVYPALRSVPGGEEVARARIDEQRQAEEELARLEKMDLQSEDFAEGMGRLKTLVLVHAGEEETQAFPYLAGSASSETMVELGRRYTAAKHTAPDHPHPHLSDTPPANKLVGSVVALFDRVRDEAGKV